MTTLPDSNILPSGSIKAGNNRYIRIIKNGTLFYSYSVPVIACISWPDENKQTVYKTDKFYSITTSRHINQFLESIGCDTPEVVNQDVINTFNE